MIKLHQGRSHAVRGNHEQAVALLTSVVEKRRGKRRNPKKTAEAAYWLGSSLVMQGETQKAITILEHDAIPNFQRAGDTSSELLASALYTLGNAMCQSKQGERAQSILEEALRVLRVTPRSDPSLVLMQARCSNHLAQSYADSKKLTEAAMLVRERSPGGPGSGSGEWKAVLCGSGEGCIHDRA